MAFETRTTTCSCFQSPNVQLLLLYAKNNNILNKRCPRINAALEKTPHWNREKFNKRRGVNSNKYGNEPRFLAKSSL